MLSIKALKPGNEYYYLALARADYYLRGGEPPGFWLGSGAAILGLTGKLAEEDFKRVYRGFSPIDGRTTLVQNAGQPNRQPGWDLTFSVPKTVSVLWSAADTHVRYAIEAAQDAALRRTIAYAEQHLAHSRIGKGGSDEVKARLVVACFPHTTSRALEPQLHFHGLFLNVGVGPDGQTRTILSRPFYQNKMLLGALFRAELAHELVKHLGVSVSRKQTWFEIDGIPSSLASEHSTRRREIEDELGRLGVDTASAAAYAALVTRKVKHLVPPPDVLRQKWTEVARRHGLSDEAIAFLCSRRQLPDAAMVLPKATKQALDALFEEHSHFSSGDFLRALAEAPASIGVSVDALCAHAEQFLRWSKEIVPLGVRNGEARYTTKTMLELEEELLSTVHKLHTTAFRTLPDKTVQKVIRKKRDFSATPSTTKNPTKRKLEATGNTGRRIAQGHKAAVGRLSDEQAAAVTHITQRPRRIALLSGYAGAAKTTTLQAVREAFEAKGYTVIGASLSGKAARELSLRAGIPSNTVRMRELELNPSLFYQFNEHRRQLGRAMRKWRTSRPERLTIGPKTVLVVDEASMIGTRDMLMLAKAVAKGGGKLILVGDEHQNPSIDAGGPFGSIKARIGAVHLQNIVRQQDPADQRAVKWMSDGEAANALAHYVRQNQVKVAQRRDELFAKLIFDWKQSRGIQEPERHVICTALNSDVDDLNDLAQALRLRAGLIDPTKRITIRRKPTEFGRPTRETFCVGDRITFTKRSRRYRVENGDTGSVVGVSTVPFAKRVSVLFDGEKEPRVVPLRATSARRGYAFTTHKLQGATADNVFVAVTGPMLNRQMAYVQLSRHRHKLSLYVPAFLAEESLTGMIALRGSHDTSYVAPEDVRSPLCSLMAKDASKHLAHDVLEHDVPTRDNRGLSRQQAEELLRSFAKSGLLATAADTDKLRSMILDNWHKSGANHAPVEHVMFASSAADRQILNRQAQELRLAAGALDRSRSTAVGGDRFYAGDYVRLDTDQHALRLMAGTTARVVDVDNTRLKLECDSTREVVTLPTQPGLLSLAYARPSDDMTRLMPKTAHVLLSDQATDVQLSCVYKSLHRESCRLYATDVIAGAGLAATCHPAKPSVAPAAPKPRALPTHDPTTPVLRVKHHV